MDEKLEEKRGKGKVRRKKELRRWGERRVLEGRKRGK